MAITDFSGKLAFITGGASGIGLGIARSMAARGASVVLADLRPDHIRDALAEFGAAGQADRVEALEMDVTDRAGFAAAAERMLEKGGIDILVNNAGVGIQGPILEAGYADWDFGLGVNLDGVVNGLQSFLPQMIGHGRGGHIVNTASLAATIVMPGQYTIYSAAKAAVVNLSENMRADLGEKDIGMSVLCPGFVRTNIAQIAKNRPQHLREGSGYAEVERSMLDLEVSGEFWLEPDVVGEMVAEAVLNNELYIITHGQFRDLMEQRAADLLAATPHSEFQFGGEPPESE